MEVEQAHFDEFFEVICTLNCIYMYVHMCCVHNGTNVASGLFDL